MRVLFAVGAWGLGHATRDLPLIRGLLGHGGSVTVASSGAALHLLRTELADACDYLPLPPTPTPLGRSTLHFYATFTRSLPRVTSWMRADHRAVEAALDKGSFDAVISDNRFGAHSRKVPSYHIAHQLRFAAPGRNRLLESALMRINARLLAPARKIFVPDVETSPGLSGALSHEVGPPLADRAVYLGILSSVRRTGVPEDLDYAISLSGPEPQRGLLQVAVLEQAASLPGKGVIALGLPGDPTHCWMGNAEVVGYLDRGGQQDVLNRSRVVVSRSGYSTLMELAALSKRAVLLPTPGQTEQVYLAAYHQRLRTFHAVDQRRLCLTHDLAAARALPGFPAPNPTEHAVQRFVDELLNDVQRAG